MPGNAPRDENFVPTALFEVDGSPGVVMPGQINQVTGRILVSTSGGGGGQVDSVIGTTNRITVDSTDPAAPIVDIAATYVGQTSITTLGTVTTGVWNGTDIALADGGTGASLVDPGADRIMFWDDSAGTVTWLTIGTNLSITDTTLNASGGGGITIGTTTITSGTNTRVLYNNSGVVGEYVITGTGNVVMSTSPILVTPLLGTPTSGVLTNCTGYPVASLANLGTGVAAALAINVGSAGAPVLFNGALGTPSSGTVTNLTGTASININGTVGATTPTTATFTTATINTSIVPDANDGAVLGSALVSWSDLFLASGGVINWNNGTLTLTQAANELTVAGTAATFVAPTIVANTAFIPDTNDGASLGTTSSQFSDLFLAEGAVINWDNGDVTLTQSGNALILAGGDLVLSENTSVQLDPTLSADGTWTGTTITGTAGYTQAFGDLVYLDPTDSRWELADANAVSGADGDARGMLAMVVVAGTDGTACTLLLQGNIRADAKFATFTVNNPLYVSETAGAITQTQPTTTDVVIRIVGTAVTADSIYFNPDGAWITHT